MLKKYFLIVQGLAWAQALEGRQRRLVPGYSDESPTISHLKPRRERAPRASLDSGNGEPQRSVIGVNFVYGMSEIN